MVTCSLIFVLRVSGATMSRLELGGQDVQFANPAGIFFALWIALLYYLYRYVLYLPDKAIPSFDAYYWESLDLRVKNVVQRQARMLWPRGFAPLDPTFMALWRKGEFYIQTSGPGENLSFQGPLPPLPIQQWPRWRLVLLAGLGFVRPVVFNRLVSDYLLPIALALFVIWYGNIGDWTGTWSRIAEAMLA